MNKPNLQSDSALYSLMLGAENELRKLRYSDSTIRHRWEVWKRYLKFSNKEDFQLQDWHDFLKKVYGIGRIAGRTYAQSSAPHGKLFKHFHQFYKEGRLQYWSLVRSDTETIPAPFCAITDLFLQHLEANGCVLSTITDYARTLRRLTKFLQQEQVESFRMLKPEHITPFIASVASYHGRSVAALLSELRQFFHYLYLNGYHERIYPFLYLNQTSCAPGSIFLPSGVLKIWKKSWAVSILVIQSGKGIMPSY
ncbi:MAG: site-specific integrase [Enterocloster sp.]|uniref:site-specific integrase n=1 Tax=Enterocloster sp. TaxID=2719315 RepID=UPI00399A4BC4